MYISVVTLPVSDVDRAVDFYTKTLGWEKTMDVSMGEDGRWVTVAPAGTPNATSFTLSSHTPAGPAKPGGMSGVILEVDDVFKTHEQLKKAGVEFADGPRLEPWGGWALFKDSEGNVHGLHSPAPVGASRN